VLAAVALVALIVPTVYLTKYRPTIVTVSAAQAQERAATGLAGYGDVRFGNRFELVAVTMRPLAGDPGGVELELVWTSLGPQQLRHGVAVHAVDGDGTIVGQVGYPQDVNQSHVDGGTHWLDVVRLPATRLAGAQAVAIGLYRESEGFLAVDRGPRDWDNGRLLIPLTMAQSTPEASPVPGEFGIGSPVASPVPGLEGLPELPDPTEGFIERVNGEVVRRPQKTPLAVPGDQPLRVTGWAVDLPGGGPASAVFLVVDGVVDRDLASGVRAEYGAPRPDVAEYLGSDVYAPVGYTAELPARTLTPGVHLLELWVVARGGSGYYVPTTTMRMEIVVDETLATPENG